MRYRSVAADTLAADAGLLRVGERVYVTSPTRRHVVVVQWEGDRWVAWAGRYDDWHERGRKPSKQWTRYQGPDLGRALDAAVKFAGRLRR